MRQYLMNIKGMRCNACSAKVHGALSSLAAVHAVEVDHQRDRAVVSTTADLHDREVQLVLSEAGGFALVDMEAGAVAPSSVGVPLTTDKSDSSAEENTPQSLFPLFLIVGYIFTVTLLIAWASSEWSLSTMMRHFMAGFFLVFSFFKFLDTSGFASAFRMYDPLAKAVPGWSWIYPYVELLLGVAYLLSWQPLATNAVTLVLMSVGGVGVMQSLLQKKTIRCACLGTALNLPMTKVTLVENGTMAAMAALMLARSI
ncbi:MAG: heavy-metal-associated domain-containing protein [Planctomycetota bacterium]